MTAVAVFDVLTDVNPEIVTSNLTKLWIYESVDIRRDPETKFITCILEHIYYHAQEKQSIINIVNYLLNISLNGQIYYYPSWECYEYDEEDEDVEISIDDIFTEKYEPSLCGWGMRFLIRKP